MEELMMCRCCGCLNHWMDEHDARLSRWAQCGGCGVFINRSPSLDTGTVTIDPRLVLRDMGKFIPIIELLKEHGLEDGYIYDICTGPGYMQAMARIMGVKAYGNDTNKSACALATKVFALDRFSIGNCEFEEVEHGRPGYIAAFTSHHGIEHVKNPGLAMHRMIDALEAGGLIYLAHPVMRDAPWVLNMGDSAHQHEWTYEAFGKFVAQFEELEVLRSTCGGFVEGQNAGQSWLLRRK